MLVKLRVANGKHAGTAYNVWRWPYLIGRHAQANLQIDNMRVSVHHCHLLLRGTEVWVRDLNSTNGTHINDDELPRGGERRLSLGDRLTVGPVVLEVLQETHVPPPPGVPDSDYPKTSPAMPPAPKTLKHARPTGAEE
jgi:pSer/pThr/pTyr-binding forkhead associated (FHA) protein